MKDARDTFDRIRALLDEGAIAPTPVNYEFLYRYVTGADPQLVEAVDLVRRTHGAIDNRSISRIRREYYGAGHASVSRILEDTEFQLARMNDYVERQDAGARDYAHRLSRSEINATATVERQRHMLAEMIEATNQMLATTEQLQNDLAASSREIEALKADLEIARVDARSDALTGLANRKAFCDYLDAQITRSHEGGRPLSLIFLDIDHFKQFNDNFGHRMGDEVLRLVAASLENFFHGRGFAARWGGEEFVIVMPLHEAQDAAHYAELFRQHISNRTVKARQTGRDVGRVTLSLGVAGLFPDDTAQTLIDRADTALYDAKAEGRDRVVCWQEAA